MVTADRAAACQYIEYPSVELAMEGGGARPVATDLPIAILAEFGEFRRALVTSSSGAVVEVEVTTLAPSGWLPARWLLRPVSGWEAGATHWVELTYKGNGPYDDRVETVPLGTFVAGYEAVGAVERPEIADVEVLDSEDTGSIEACGTAPFRRTFLLDLKAPGAPPETWTEIVDADGDPWWMGQLGPGHGPMTFDDVYVSRGRRREAGRPCLRALLFGPESAPVASEPFCVAGGCGCNGAPRGPGSIVAWLPLLLATIRAGRPPGR